MAAFAFDSLSYNDFAFDDTAQFISTRCLCTPVYDDAKRMIIGNDFTIDVKGKFTGGTDAQMNTIKATLQTPGKKLTYTSRGYGTFIINDPAIGVWDVNWGPKPGSFNYVPLGMGQACAFEWTVTTRIPTCLNSLYANVLMMSCYSQDWDIDEQGLTHIAVSGTIEIPLTFRNNLMLPDNADAYRERCFPPVPQGFQRMTKHSKLSADRKRLDYSYTDRELPVPLPPGATMAEIRHQVRNAKKNYQAQKKWTNTISGTVRMSPLLPKITAFDRFMFIAIQRIRRAVTFAQQNQPAADAPMPQAPNGVGQAYLRALESGVFGLLGRGALAVAQNIGGNNESRLQYVPLFLEMSENIFGLDSSFSISYDIIMPTNFNRVAEANGLWTWVGTDAASWKNSMDVANGPNSPRGIARMQYRNEEDTFVDLCTAARSGQARPNAQNGSAYESRTSAYQPDTGVGAVGGGDFGGGDGDLNGVTPQALSPSVFANNIPPLEQSWLSYETFYIYHENDNIAIHKPLAGTVTQSAPVVDPFSTDSIRREDDFGTGVSATVPDIVQRLSSPSVRVTLIGSAERIGYEINPPRLTRFRGKEVQQLSQILVPSISQVVQGVPVYKLLWRLEYVILTPPDKLPVLANPMLATTGESLNYQFQGGP